MTPGRRGTIESIAHRQLLELRRQCARHEVPPWKSMPKRRYRKLAGSSLGSSGSSYRSFSTRYTSEASRNMRPCGSDRPSDFH